MKSTLLKIVCLSSLIIQCGEKEQPSSAQRYFKNFGDLVKNLSSEVVTELTNRNLLNEKSLQKFKTDKGYDSERINELAKDPKLLNEFEQEQFLNKIKNEKNKYIEYIIGVCQIYNIIKENEKETKNTDDIKRYFYDSLKMKYCDENILSNIVNQLDDLKDPDLKKGGQVISIIQSLLNTIIENAKKNIWDIVMKQTYSYGSIPPVALDKIQINTSGTKIDINGNIKEYEKPVLSDFDFQYKDNQGKDQECKMKYVTTQIIDGSDLVLQIQKVINQIKQNEENNNFDKKLQEKLREYEFDVNKGQKTIDDLKNEINKVRENTNKILDLKTKDEFKNLGSQVDNAAKQYFNRYKSEIMSTFNKVTGVNYIIVNVYKGLDIFNLPNEVKFNNKTVIEVFNECFNNELVQYFDNTKDNDFKITLTKTLDVNDAKIDSFKIVTGFEDIQKGETYKCVTNKASEGYSFKVDEILLDKLKTFICNNVKNELLNLFKDTTKYSNCQNDNKITKLDQLNKFFNDKFTYDNIPGNESKTEKLDELLSIKITDYIKDTEDSGNKGFIKLFTDCSKNVISRAFGNSSDFKDFLSKLKDISAVSVLVSGETIVNTGKGLAAMDATNLNNWGKFNDLCKKIFAMKEAMKKILIAIADKNSPFKDFLEKYLIGRIGYNFVDQDFVDIAKLDDSSLASKIEKNTLLCYNYSPNATAYGTLLHKWIFVDYTKWNTDKNDDRLIEIVKTNEKLAEFIFCNNRQFATRDGGVNTYKTKKIANLNRYFKGTNVSFTDQNELEINTIFVFSNDGKYVYEDCDLSKPIKIEKVSGKDQAFIAESGDYFCEEIGNIDMNHILALFGDWTGNYLVARFCQCDYNNNKKPTDGKEKGWGNYVYFKDVVEDVQCDLKDNNNINHWYLIR